MTIGALEENDTRQFAVAVAGPTALLVAKLHKLSDRQEHAARRSDKDALDIYRLLRTIETEDFATVLDNLRHNRLTEATTRDALRYLHTLFGTATAPGSQMAAQAVQPLMSFDEVVASCAILAQELLAQVQER